jgi:hypothetical protein
LIIDRTCPLELKVVEDTNNGQMFTAAQCQARVTHLCRPGWDKKHTLRGIMGRYLIFRSRYQCPY